MRGAELREERYLTGCISICDAWGFVWTSMTLQAAQDPSQPLGLTSSPRSQCQPVSGTLGKAVQSSFPNCSFGVFNLYLQFVLPATYNQRNTCQSCNKCIINFHITKLPLKIFVSSVACSGMKGDPHSPILGTPLVSREILTPFNLLPFPQQFHSKFSFLLISVASL